MDVVHVVLPCRLNVILPLIAGFALSLINIGATEFPSDSSARFNAITQFAIPCFVYIYGDNRQNKGVSVPCVHLFEWSHNKATLSVIIIKICLFVGWEFATFELIILAGGLAHFITNLALNIGTHCGKWKIDYRSSITISEALAVITYLITSTFAVYYVPLGTLTFVQKRADCFTRWLCYDESTVVKSESQAREVMLCLFWISAFLYYKTYKVFTASELILETVHPDSELLIKMVLKRKGSTWEVDMDQSLLESVRTNILEEEDDHFAISFYRWTFVFSD